MTQQFQNDTNEISRTGIPDGQVPNETNEPSHIFIPDEQLPNETNEPSQTCILENQSQSNRHRLYPGDIQIFYSGFLPECKS
jgi:hypothetical protein